MPLRNPLQRLALKLHTAGTVDAPPDGAMRRATYLHLGIAALGFAGLVTRDVGMGVAFATALVVFVLLCAALFDRRAGWVSAVLGTAFAASAAFAVALAFSGVLAASAAGLAALAIAVHTYHRILRRPRRFSGG